MVITRIITFFSHSSSTAIIIYYSIASKSVLTAASN